MQDSRRVRCTENVEKTFKSNKRNQENNILSTIEESD